MIISYIDKIIFSLFLSLFSITPLVVLPVTSELFEFNKIIFIYLITVLILFFWIFKMILLKKIILKKTSFDVFFLLFFISQGLSTLFSIDKHTSIYGYYGRFNGGLFSLTSYFVLYYAFISNITKDKIERILKLSLFTSTLTVLIGLPGKFNRDLLCLFFAGNWSNNCWTEQFKPAERMFSTLGQPNWLGAYLAINFFIALYFYFKNTKEKIFPKNLILLLVITIIFAGILFSRSRSAILTTIFLLAINLIFFFIINYFKKPKDRLIELAIKKSITVLIILLLTTVIFKTGINQIDKYFNLVILDTKKIINNEKIDQTKQTTNILVTESLDIRKIVWRGAIELGKKYPLFGTGVETFGYSYYFVRPKEHNLTSEWDYLYNKAHNEYLNYLATTGFVGLGTYLLMISSIIFIFISKIFNLHFSIFNQTPNFKNLLRINKEKDQLLMLILLFLIYLSILTTNFFGFSTTTINLFFFLIPGFIVVLSSKQSTIDNQETKQLSKKPSLSQTVLFICLLLTISYLVFNVFRYWLADVTYAKAEKYIKLGHYQQAVNHLNQALQLRYEHVYEDKLSNYLAVLALIAANQNEKQMAKRLILASQFFNEKSMKAAPKNILYLKTKAKNYYLYYQILSDKKLLSEAINSLSLAYQYAPTDPKIPYTIAVFFNLLRENTKDKIEQKQLADKALNFINQSINLKPNYREPLFLKGQILQKIGQKKEAKEILKTILQKINPDDEEVKKELEILEQ